MSNKTTFLPSFFIYNFNVSTLSHHEFCGIRSKIEVLNRNSNFDNLNKTMRIGTKMHTLYTYPNKSFDRILCKSKLNKYAYKKHGMYIFSKEIDAKKYKIRVNGSYDDLRIVKVGDKKYTVLIEIKTTAKKYMWSHEVKAAKRQLQLYMWLLKELLEKIGFQLWKRGYVEIYSQKTGKCIKIYPVEYDENIETWIKQVVETFMGLRSVRIPDYKLCRFCPKWVKQYCSWYKIRKSEKSGIKEKRSSWI